MLNYRSSNTFKVNACRLPKYIGKKGILDCCTATVKSKVIKKEHCWMYNAITLVNNMPSSGSLFAIPVIEF